MNEYLALSKGLITKENNLLYKNIENVYKYFFENFLMTKVNLKYYDELINNSELDFGIPHPNNKQLISGLKEYMNLKYIYILNNFFIEKLEIKDIDFIKKRIKESNFIYDKEIEEFINRTYKQIILNNYKDGNYTEEKYEICYGANIPDNFVRNDALVMKIFYSRNTKELNDELYIKNIEAKKVFLNDIINRIIKDINICMGINCNILVRKISK